MCMKFKIKKNICFAEFLKCKYIEIESSWMELYRKHISN